MRIIGYLFHRWSRRAFAGIFLLSLTVSLLAPQINASAAVTLSVVPLTWNVIGLDSNNVAVGPNNFPVGARVCNTGSTAATNVVAAFVWDSSNSFIDLRPGSLQPITLPVLAAGSAASPSCFDFYFEVTIQRNPAAYDTARRYHISVTATGGISLQTPTPREIYVEHLISQNRNSTNDVKLDGISISPGGTMSLLVGNTYTIELDGSTATQGYNQFEDFINFPNTIFEVLSVQSHYSADSSGYVANSSDKLYADACLWDNNPLSLTYRSCIGSDGKVGGTISTIYTVKIIGGAGTSQVLNTLIYDFSGSSYHYNSDFSTQNRLASISSPLTMTKSFSPVSIAAGGTSTLSITINNLAGSAVSGIGLTDPLPSGLTISGSPVSPQCGGTLTSTSGSITLTDGSITANGSCTLQATVTSSANGVYANTTNDLTISGGDTGVRASASLTVAPQTSGGGLCTAETLASWTVPSTATNPPDRSGTSTTPGVPLAGQQAADVATANLFANLPGSTAIDNKSGVGDSFSWSTYGYGGAGQYIEFDIDTSRVSAVSMTFHVANPGAGNGPGSLVLAYDNGNGTGFHTVQTITSPVTVFAAHTQDFTGLTSTTGLTRFRLTATGANNNTSAGNLLYDNMSFTGLGNCTAPIQPSLTKAFSPATIGLGTSSTLQFTLTNTNTTQLTGAAFTDTLPGGLTVATGTSTACGGTLTTTAPNSISFSGGTIPAKVGSTNGTCTASITVTGASAGKFTNTSGFISTKEGGTNNTASGYGTANLIVLAPPIISKSFSPNPMYAGNNSTLTFVISNPNTGTALSGVAFTDDLPLGLTVPTAPVASQCGGNVSTSIVGGQARITLVGGTLAAGGACTVTVVTTASTAGNYVNTSGAVSATTAGTGNTATDTLNVQTVHPGIAVLKQVALNVSGPWASTTEVAPGGNVFYRITIENVGDVPLSPVSVDDPALDISSCAWPPTLPVGSSTVDPTATCILGPVSAQSPGGTNTATAHGTYGGTVYNSSPSTATYATTSLSLVKSVTETSFSAAGDLLHYSYVITNTSASSITGTLVMTDSNVSVFSCPDAVNPLPSGQSIHCTATYTVTAFDVSVGSITNTAYAAIGTTVSNTDRRTVFRNLPDLIVSKGDNTGGHTTAGTLFTWTVTIANQGSQAATFSAGQRILSDQLPSSGATYGTPTIGTTAGITGLANITCAIDGSQLLTCSAGSGSVTIGATTGSFAVHIPVTSSVTGSLVNIATVDPDNVVAESNEGNNTGSDTVTVNAAATATPTNAPTSTPTVTPTSTPIATPTSTPTDTPTAAGSATSTPTNTPTATPTDTPTNTPTDTPTATSTTTSTPTNTPTATPTNTPTNTPTDTPTNTPTSTPTSTPTHTPTATSTSTPANAPTATPTSTPQVGGVSGVVFNDANANTTQDGSEAGLSGVTVYLYDSTGTTLLASTITDVSGHYSFTNVPVNDYRVVEVDPSGYTSTTPNTVAITVPADGAAVANFGDLRLAGSSNNSIHGVVYEDANANGSLDSGETALSGVTVTLYDQNNVVVGTTTTGSTGGYGFSNLPPGVYTVVETNPGGYVSTTPDHVSVPLSSGTNAVVNFGDQRNQEATIVDPAVTKFGAPSTATVGDPVLFTLTVTNNGNADALNVALTDTLPAFLDIVNITISPDKGFTVLRSGNAFTISFGTVTPGDFYTVTVLTRVNNLGQPPGGANNASITTRSPGDPVFNDRASASLTIAGTGSSGGAALARAHLPSTGFAPGVTTLLPSQPQSSAYTAENDVWLEIPRLGLRMPILGIPFVKDTWDVSWLSNQAGWLQGTAFPSWSGNSVLTGHVTLANGLPGPFLNLHNLTWGDQVIVHVGGDRYVYQVRSDQVLVPEDVSVLQHENSPWLTLLTCKDYNPVANSYSHRVAVRAVLVKVALDTSQPANLR